MEPPSFAATEEAKLGGITAINSTAMHNMGLLLRASSSFPVVFLSLAQNMGGEKLGCS